MSVATQTPGARLAAAGSSPPSRGGGGWIWTRGVPVVAVLLGLVLRLRLRLREYTFNRSLFPDEVTLTHDVVGRTFGQLLHVNPNGQAAPIGWLWTSKVATVVFGQHDLTLRLVPFLASVVALLLFPYVGRELVGRWAMPAALLLFATSPALIYYASEAKQYSSDVTCTLLALAITLAVYQRRPGPRPALAWALLASGVIWFSQPGILLVALGGAVLALRWLRRPQGLRWLIVAAVPPLVVLGIDYVVVLRDQAASTLLKNYWAAGSPPAPLQLRSASSWLYRDVNNALGDPGHLAHPVLVLTLCAVGALVLVSRRAWRWPTLLLLSPLLIAVIVGVARVYPLRQRLALYLLPLVYLLMCSGLRVLDQALRPRLRIWGQGVAAVVTVMVGVTRDRGSPAESRSWPARWITPWAGRRCSSSPTTTARAMRSTASTRGPPWTTPTTPPGTRSCHDRACSASCPVTPRAPTPPTSAGYGFTSVPGCTSKSHAGKEPPDSTKIFLSYFRSVGTQLDSYTRPGASGGAYLFQVTGSGPAPLPGWQPNTCFVLQ